MFPRFKALQQRHVMSLVTLGVTCRHDSRAVVLVCLAKASEPNKYKLVQSAMRPIPAESPWPHKTESELIRRSELTLCKVSFIKTRAKHTTIQRSRVALPRQS